MNNRRHIKMEAQLEREIRDYIHNDLSNAAFYLKKKIEERLEAGDREGIFLDMMAALTMVAFSMEANLNFIGAKVIENWKEKQSGEKKWIQVLDHLGIEPDYNTRPFSSVEPLRVFRDTLAHGKPRVLDEIETAIGTYDELYAQQEVSRRSPWEEHVTIEALRERYEDMESIWSLMLSSAGIEIHDTLSGWSGGMTYKRDAD